MSSKNEELITAQEAADMAGVARTNMYAIIARGRIPIAGYVLENNGSVMALKPSDVQHYMDTRKRGGRAQVNRRHYTCRTCGNSYARGAMSGKAGKIVRCLDCNTQLDAWRSLTGGLDGGPVNAVCFIWSPGGDHFERFNVEEWFLSLRVGNWPEGSIWQCAGVAFYVKGISFVTLPDVPTRYDCVQKSASEAERPVGQGSHLYT